MIKKFVFIVVLLVMLQAQNVMAHADGHGPVSPKMAEAIAVDAVQQFSDSDPGLGFGQLGSNWKAMTIETAKVETKGDGYYIVSVESKAEGKTLYVLMSASGSVYDANFTGKFPKLK